MSDKDHNGDMVNLLGPKKAKKVKKGVDTTKKYLGQDRWVLVASVTILVISFLLVSLSGYVSNLRQDDIKQVRPASNGEGEERSALLCSRKTDVASTSLR